LWYFPVAFQIGKNHDFWIRETLDIDFSNIKVLFSQQDFQLRLGLA